MLDNVELFLYTILKVIDTHQLEEPTNEDQHRSKGRKDKRNMSTEIKYSRDTRDYDVTIDGNYLGSARNYSEGEIMANEYITEQTAQAARALPQSVQDFLTTLDDAPALPAVFTATSAEPLDAMLAALEQAERLINRLGTKVVSQTSEVTISVCGQPLTTVVVVVAPRVAAKVAA